MQKSINMGDQEDPLTSSIIPHSLVMTFEECEYCGQTNTAQETVMYLFGIKTCNEHIRLAKKDCEAYMHERKMVKINDALRTPVLKEFFEYLDEFPVKRTSGVIENGWSILMNDAHISFFKETWNIHVCNKSDINKKIPISEFLNDEIIEAMPNPPPKELVERVIDILNEGVYKSSYLIYLSENPTKYIDPPFVQTTLCDGNEVRVLVPENTVECQI